MLSMLDSMKDTFSSGFVLLRFFIKRIALLPVLLLITLSVHLVLHQTQSAQKTIVASQSYASAPVNYHMLAEALPDDALQSHSTIPPPTWWQLVSNLIRFDYGNSIIEHRSAWHVMSSKAPISITITLVSLGLLYASAIMLATYHAKHHMDTLTGWVAKVLMICSIIPSSLLGLALITMFASAEGFDIFPIKFISYHAGGEQAIGGWIMHTLWYLTLPLMTLLLPRILPLTQFIHASYVKESQEPYVHYARIKGMDEQAIFQQHIQPNVRLAIISTLPRTFLKLLFSSTLIIEVLFSIDGLGYLAYRSALSHDYSVVFALLTLCTTVTAVCYFALDIAFYHLDPRLRTEALT